MSGHGPLADRIFGSAIPALRFLAAGLLVLPGALGAQTVDLVLNLTDSPDPIPAGGVISYTATVLNDAGVTATGVTYTFSIPAGTSYDGVTGAGVSCSGASIGDPGPLTLTCALPDQIPGNPATIFTILVRTTVASITSVSASLTANQTEATPGDNSDVETTTVVSGADVTLGLSGPTTAPAGSSVSYSILLTNAGPDPASELRTEFPVPTGLVLTGSLPAGCVLATGTVTCAVSGSIGAAGSRSIGPFTAQVASGSGSTITLAASVQVRPGAPFGTPQDPNSGDNSATLNTAVTAGSDVRITKARGGSAPFLVGDSLDFTLTASYTGDAPTGLTISDVVPGEYTILAGLFAASQGGWSCGLAGQTVTCTRPGGAAAGANQPLGSIVIPVEINSPGVGVVNSATIDAVGPFDPNTGNNVATDGGTTLQVPTADLALSKTGPNPALVVIDQPFDYTLRVSNAGPAPFAGTVVVTDTLPAGLDLSAIAATGWVCTPGAPQVGPAVIVCSATYDSGTPLASGANAPVIVLTTIPRTAGSLVNRAGLTTTNPSVPDPNAGNDGSGSGVTASPPGASADIRVLKSVDLATVPAGDPLTYTLEIVNDGSVDSRVVQLTDDLATLISSGVGPTGEGLIGVTIIPGGIPADSISCGTTTISGGRRLACTVTTLPPCTAGVDCPRISVAIRPGGDGGSRTNTVSVISTATADSNLANNSAGVSSTVLARADVRVTKVATPDPVAAGQELIYVVTALNDGPSRADAVTISDTLPLGVIFVSAVPSAGSCSLTPGAGVETTPALRFVTCTLNSIANNGQQTVTIRVRPTNATRGGTITNQVGITTSTVEPASPGTTNNGAAATVAVADPSLDLLINKTDSVDPASVGDVTSYTVTVTNVGPSDAENVVVTDTLPAIGLSYVSHGFAAGTCSTVPTVGAIGGVLACDVTRLGAGASATLTVVMQGEVKGIYTNRAAVASAETPLGFENSANNSIGEVTTVRTRADMRITSKVATPGTIAVRRPFSWTILVENLAGPGLAEADTVVVSDNLPAGMELTGTPTVVIVSGGATLTTCTGTAGGTSFTCPLGTVANPSVIEITVPVRALSVPTGGVATNTAAVAAFSQDLVPGNNSGSGAVTITGSSLSGTVFRDFNDNATIDAGDTGISGITITLSGTAFDASAVSRTTTTNGSGVFSFAGLPEGSYTITRGAVTEAHLVVGQQTAGDRGGAAGVLGTISGITLAETDAGAGYRFGFVPLARVGVAKQLLAGPAVNPNGSYTATLRLRVRNYSLEAVSNATLSDPLSGPAPSFGSHVAGGAAAALVPGEYTIQAAPSFVGSCTSGILTASYDGAGQPELVQIGSLAPNTTCTVDFQLRYQPIVPLPGGGYANQAAVSATGALSGQTPTDLSQNGTNADPDNDDDPTDNNAPTPMTPVLVADVTTQVTLPGPVDAGQPVNGTVVFQNTGPYASANTTYTLTLPAGLTGVGFSNLPPGATATYNPTTGQVTLAAMPAVLASGEIASADGVAGIGFTYTQPGVATSTVTGGIATTTSQGSNAAPDAATATVVGTPIADVTTAVTAPASIDAGQVVSTTVRFENVGPSTATGMTYGITLTPGLSGVALGNLPVGAAASYDPGTGIVTFTGMPTTLDSGVVASGNGTSGISVAWNQPGAATSTITTSIGTATSQGANVAPDAAAATVPGQPIADVTTALTFPVNADAGVTVNGTVTFGNTGPSTAADVSYTLTLTPNLAGLTFGNLPPGATATYDPTSGVVTFANMPATLDSGVVASGNGTTGITVSYVQPGDGMSNVTSGIGTSTDQGANVALDNASASPGGGLIADVTTVLTFPAVVDAGDPVAGTVLFQNNGPSIASGVGYTLTLDPGLSGVMIGNLPPGATASYDPGTGVVTFTGMPTDLGIGAIASGDGTTPITVGYTQPGNATSAVSSSISTTTNQDANFAPDAASTSLAGALIADVTVDVTFPAVVDATTTASGTITFRNAGPSTASGVAYTLTLTPGLVGVTFGNLPMGATASYDPGTGVVTFANMPVTLDSGVVASGDGTTGITLGFQQPDDGLSAVTAGIGTSTSQGANALPDSDTAAIVGPVADVTTALSFPATADAGQAVAGTVLFRNDGPSAAADVGYTLTLAPGLTGVVIGNLPPGASASYDPATGVVTFTGMPATLAPGQIASGDGVGGITVSYVQAGSGTSTVSSTISTSTNQAANVGPDAATLTIAGGMVADLVVTKSNGTTGVTAGELTTYLIRVTNLGPSDVLSGARLTDVAVALTIEQVTCSALAVNSCATPPTPAALTAGIDLPPIASGGAYELEVVARVTGFTGDATNSASVTLPPDVTDPVPTNNGATDSDPIAATAGIGLAKRAGPVSDNGDGSFDVTFSLLVENLGGTPLTDVQVTDLLLAFGNPAAGAAPGPGEFRVLTGPTITEATAGATLTPVASGGYTGFGAGGVLLDAGASALQPGASARIGFSIRFVPIASGSCLNSASATGRSPGGTVVTDVSVDGDVPDPDRDVPTPVACRVQALGLAKAAGAPLQIGSRRFRVAYTLVVRNTDSLATATNVQVEDDLRPTFPVAERLTIVGAVQIDGCSGTQLAPSPVPFDGAGQPRLLRGDQSLLPGESCTIRFTVDIDFGATAVPNVPQLNRATATSAATPGGVPIGHDDSQNGPNPDPDGDGDPRNNDEKTPVVFVEGAALVITKTTPLVNVRVGQLVPYTITVENLSGGSFTALDLRDMLPAGFGYRTGTASLDGTPAEPTVVGRDLVWSGIDVAPGQVRVLRLLLVVGAGVQPGEYVNIAGVYDPAIAAPADPILSALATAAVRVVPDAVFDCSDLIGKVFDDRNGNGVQDRGEPGLANVRLATALGWLVSTDPEGRFHIACGVVPDGERGSTFVLKLDERTLPTGYVVTTENPRTIRVTAGKMAQLDFGAALFRTVTVEMTDEAFDPQSGALRPTWRAQLETLAVDSTDRRPVRALLHYRAARSDDPSAHRRLGQVAELLRARWRTVPWLAPSRVETTVITAGDPETDR